MIWRQQYSAPVTATRSKGVILDAWQGIVIDLELFLEQWV